jgi:hypothetical protein
MTKTMSIAQKAQAVIEAVPNAPAHVNIPVMLGSLVISFLQPLAIGITITWGLLQIHGYVKREFNRDFLWLSRLFGRKGK